MPLANSALQDHVFLEAVESEEFWPKASLNRGRRLLEKLCAKLDEMDEADLDSFYELTQAMTEDFNAMAEAGLNITAVAHDSLAADIEAIAAAYGLDDADVEEALSSREW